jgi:hypothetical protein
MAKIDKKTQRQIAYRQCREYLDLFWVTLRKAREEHARTGDKEKYLKTLKPLWNMARIHWVNLIKALWPF